MVFGTQKHYDIRTQKHYDIKNMIIIICVCASAASSEPLVLLSPLILVV
jgi:uncharacterized ubiquitin-like protein YukD